MGDVEDIVICGDLILACTKDDATQKFRVRSTALSDASAVFDRMLHGPFQEGQPSATGSKAVEVVDDIQALRTFLRLAHNRPTPAPAPSATELLDLAILADKYDARHLVWHFIHSHAGLQYNKAAITEVLQFLCVDYFLGFDDLFHKHTMKLIGGDDDIPEDSESFEHLLNHRIVRDIKRQRKDHRHDMQTLLLQYLGDNRFGDPSGTLDNIYDLCQETTFLKLGTGKLKALLQSCLKEQKQSLSYCDQRHHNCTGHDTVDLERIAELLDEIESTGLQLKHYKRERENAVGMEIDQ